MGQISDLEIIFGSVLCGGLDQASVDTEKVDLNNLRDTQWYKTKKEVYPYAYPKLIHTFTYNIFKDEYYFLFEVLKDIKLVAFTVEQLGNIIDNHRAKILKSKGIDLNKYSLQVGSVVLSEDEKFLLFKGEVINLYKRLTLLTPTRDEFDTALALFIEKYKVEYLQETAQQLALITQDGLTVNFKGKKTFMHGSDDYKKYADYRNDFISKLTTEEKLVDKSTGIEMLEEFLEASTQGKDDGVLDTGIREIDEVKGKFGRGHLVTIAGKTKGGKTRFTNYLVERARRMGLNVCVWAMEGSISDWEACQISLLMRHGSGVSIDSGRVKKRAFEDAKVLEMVNAYATKFHIDENLGKLSFIKGTGYVEDFIEVLENHYNNVNQFDVIVIDQLINIQSYRNKDQVPRIREAYLLFKDYIENKCLSKPLAIVPAQITRDTMAKMRTNKDREIDEEDIAECSEVVRSSDEIIALYCTDEEKEANQMKFYDVVSRHHGNFKTFIAEADLGCCYFASRGA